MRRLRLIAPVLLVGVWTLAPASDAVAQNPVGQPRLPSPAPLKAPAAHMSLSELTPTPQMWFYEQERRRYEDPRQAVRANAEVKSTQRRQRLAALQWFGYSNARPTRSATPTHNTSSPRWGSNNPSDPDVWSGTGGRPTIVLAPETTYVR